MFNLSKYRISFVLALFTLVLGACGKKEAPVVDATIAPVRVAVNSEFLPTAKLLADRFTTSTAIGVEFTSGSDAELLGMIEEGADVDIYMASNSEYPRQLIAEGKALSDGASVYALGIPALYSRNWKLNWNARDFLVSGQFSTLALPTAENPYGAAAVSALKDAGVLESVTNKLVYTDNEAESLELVNTRAADAGFIVFSSISDREKRWAWVVPQELYPPIEQGAVILKKDDINQSSEIWMGYLGSDEARSIIRQSGYGLVENQATASSE